MHMIQTPMVALGGDRTLDSRRPHRRQHQASGVTSVLNATWVDPWVGGVGSFISLTGSWAAFRRPSASSGPQDLLDSCALAGGFRLGAPGEPHHASWPDCVRPADHRGHLGLAGKPSTSQFLTFCAGATPEPAYTQPEVSAKRNATGRGSRGPRTARPRNPCLQIKPCLHLL